MRYKVFNMDNTGNYLLPFGGWNTFLSRVEVHRFALHGSQCTERSLLPSGSGVPGSPTAWIQGIHAAPSPWAGAACAALSRWQLARERLSQKGLDFRCGWSVSVVVLIRVAWPYLDPPRWR
jgi:hypothetical protein